jgi:large subunit ribosomal protein L29
VNAEELRSLEAEDLRAKVASLREDLFRIRFQHATAQLSNSAEVRQTRRTLARALTILNQRDNAAPQEG